MKTERLTVEDWERYRTIRLRALADTPDAFARTLAEETEFAPDKWRARLTDGAANFVALVNEADAGLVTGAKWHGRDGVAGLFSMWVAPEFRRKGVGEGLVRTVIGWARSSGFKQIALDVGDANRPAIRFYSHMGFEPTGRTGHLPPPRQHVLEHERALVL